MQLWLHVAVQSPEQAAIGTSKVKQTVIKSIDNNGGTSSITLIAIDIGTIVVF